MSEITRVVIQKSKNLVYENPAEKGLSVLPGFPDFQWKFSHVCKPRPSNITKIEEKNKRGKSVQPFSIDARSYQRTAVAFHFYYIR